MARSTNAPAALKPSLAPAAYGETNEVPADVFAILEAVAAEIADCPRYTDKSFYLEDQGDNERHLVTRGGIWNATEVGRLATYSDRDATRRELRALGYVVSKDEVDALLEQVIRGALVAEEPTTLSTVPAPALADALRVRFGGVTRRDADKLAAWLVTNPADPYAFGERFKGAVRRDARRIVSFAETFAAGWSPLALAA